MQAPTYTPVTNFADDERNNAAGRSTVRTDRVDAELDAIEVTLDALCENLELIQRDDGKLRDAIVEPYHLSSTTKAYVLATRWTARGLWVSAVAYAVNDMVEVLGVSYICVVAHVSGVFATDRAVGKWQVFVGSADAATQSFTPTATIAASTVQTAIEEVDTELRAASLPLLSVLFGGF